MGNKVSLEENLIELRIVSKQMSRSAKKCEKNEKAALAKLKKVRSVCTVSLCSSLLKRDSHTHARLFVFRKKAIEQGNSEGARIYGQDAIREKNQALNHIRMASRLDACCSRIETAVRMNQVSSGMRGVVKGMDKSLQSMDIEKLSQLMDKFEQQFEDLDVKTGYMESTMNATTAVSTPAEQVDELIGRVADEHNLELGEAFTEAGPIGTKKPAVPVQKEKQPVAANDLEARLANLRS
jgi:charged multivesicular body protein 1